MPKVFIFAGGNGSGKTTLAHSVLEPSIQFINADEIKTKEKLSSMEAGKKALASIDRLIVKKKSFAFETTMAGLGLLNRLEAMKRKNYNIAVFYLFVYPLELLDERIKERVKKGGHVVGYPDIKRRYYRSVYNFWTKYKNYSDEWTIINNNEYQYKNIAVGDKDQSKIIDEKEFGRFKEVLAHAKK